MRSSKPARGLQAARKARDLAQRTFDITKKEQELGAGSSYQTLSAQRDLSLAELDLVTAMTIYEKAKVELDRATGATLEHNGIQIQDAVSGTVGDTISAAQLINGHADFHQIGRDFARRLRRRAATTGPVSWRPTISSTFSKPSNCSCARKGTRWRRRRSPGAGSRGAGHGLLRCPAHRPELHARHDFRPGRPRSAF